MSDTTDIWVQEVNTNLILAEDSLVVEYSDVELISTGEAGPAGSPGVSGATFSLPGDLVNTTGLSRYYMSSNGTLHTVYLSVGVPDPLHSIIITLRLNTTNVAIVTLTANQYVVSSSLTINYNAGDYFTVDVQASGGKNLVAQLIYS
jgi:hypothetical protein